VIPGGVDISVRHISLLLDGAAAAPEAASTPITPRSQVRMFRP